MQREDSTVPARACFNIISLQWFALFPFDVGITDIMMLFEPSMHFGLPSPHSWESNQQISVILYEVGKKVDGKILSSATDTAKI